MNVLIVDDEPLLLEELVEHLNLSGYRAFGAGDLVTAIDLLNEIYTKTALVTDLSLADGSGLDLVRLIKDRPDLQSLVVPILIMTGQTDLLENAGLRDAAGPLPPILAKPIDLAMLHALLPAFC